MFSDQPVQNEDKIFGGRYSDIKIDCEPPQKVRLFTNAAKIALKVDSVSPVASLCVQFLNWLRPWRLCKVHAVAVLPQAARPDVTEYAVPIHLLNGSAKKVMGPAFTVQCTQSINCTAILAQ
jgi:hypothetical protein